MIPWSWGEFLYVGTKERLGGRAISHFTKRYFHNKKLQVKFDHLEFFVSYGAGNRI